MSKSRFQQALDHALEQSQRSDLYLSLSEEAFDAILPIPFQDEIPSMEVIEEGINTMDSPSMHSTSRPAEIPEVTADQYGEKFANGVLTAAKGLHVAAKRLTLGAVKEVKPVVAKWHQDRELERERTIQNFKQRRSLTTVIRNRLAGVERTIHGMEDKQVELKSSRLRPFVEGDTLPHDPIGAIQNDAAKETHDFNLLVEQQDHALRFVTQIFNELDTSSDAQFDFTFNQRIGRIDSYSLDRVFVNGSGHYLGNTQASLQNTLTDRQDFLADFAQRNNYRFVNQMQPYDFDTSISLSKADVLSLAHAAKKYLDGLNGTDQQLIRQNVGFQELQTKAFLIEANEDPKHSIETINKYRDRVHHLQEVALPLLKHFDHLAGPMYADIQRKAMALMHLCEQWVYRKEGQRE